VTDPVCALEGVDILGVEHVADEAGLDVVVLLEPVVGDDSSGLLAAVLESIQRVIEGAGGVTVRYGDADDAALLVHYSLLCQPYSRRRADLPKPHDEQTPFLLW
jgi:hypothetical protein